MKYAQRKGGARVGVPSQASAKDGLFVNDRAK